MNPTVVEIVQARTHVLKFNKMKALETWYQLTLKYKNAKGEEMYNVLERHEKGKKFKFVKFNI